MSKKKGEKESTESKGNLAPPLVWKVLNLPSIQDGILNMLDNSYGYLDQLEEEKWHRAEALRFVVENAEKEK